MESQKIKVNFKIFPFGHIQLEIIGRGKIKESILEKPITYTEPITTNQQAIQYDFRGQDYKEPKTH